MTEIIELTPTQTTQGCCGTTLRHIETAAATQVSADFQVLAHPIRVQLLHMLAHNGDDVCVCDLEAAVPVKQPTVSYHLKLLREAGLVEATRRGPWAYYALNRERLTTLRQRLAAHLSGLEA